MTVRQAIWRKLAGLAVLALGALQATAQTPRPLSDANVQRTSANIPGDKVAAVVNNETIPMSEVRKVLDARPYPVTLSEEQKKSLRQAAVDMLVDDLLMRQYLQKQIPQVDPQELAKEYQSLKEGLLKEKKTLDQMLKEGGLTEDQLQADIIARIRWRNFLQKQCPETSLRKYYDDNKPFFDRVMVKASHILVKLPANSSAEQRQQAQQRLLAVRQEIMAGRLDFASAAKKYSDCPSKEKGGDIGLFPYKFVVYETIARTAFSLQKGAISDVVATDAGLHILRVDDRTPGEPSNFETMREVVREVWAQDQELHQRILAEQRKVSQISVNIQ